MYIIIFSTILLGLILSFFGFKELFQQISLRKKAQRITISKEERLVSFEDEGIFSISFSASSYFNPSELKMRLKDHNGKDVWLEQNRFHYKFFHSGTRWEEGCSFEIEKKGNYTISLPADSRTSLEVLVSKTRKNTDKILAILFSVFGFNILGWGIMLAFNPDILNKLFP